MTRANDLDANATTTYTYDSGGNITTVKTYAYTTGTLGTVLSTINYTYPTNGWNDRLDTYNGAKINYDAIGNPTTYRDNMSFTWELGRRLKTFSAPSMNASYTYNDAGIRTSKTVNGTTTRYVVSGSQILRLTQGQNTMDFYYDEAGQVYGLSFNGTRYYYLRNGQGDIVGIANTSGAQVVAYSYDTWGKLLSKTANSILADLNPFRYRAYCYDEESGLYYLNSRYYDPVTGRFINADSQVEVGNDLLGMNMFAYCGNDPVNRIDPSGHFWAELVRFVEEVVAQAVTMFKVLVPVYVGGALATQMDGPLPYADLVVLGALATVTTAVVGVAIYQASQSTTQSATLSQAKTKTKDPEGPKYWEAWLPKSVLGAPIQGRELTYPEARQRVANGKSIICVDHAAALAIAQAFPKPEGPELSEGEGYLWHYHVKNREAGLHIWFYGLPPLTV